MVVKEVLLITIALFLAMLLFRFVRAILLGRRISREQSCRPGHLDDPELEKLLKSGKGQGGKVSEILREIERSAESGSAPLRATKHCAAGHLAVTEMKRPKLAVGFYLRALREDPTCVPAMDRLQEILLAQKRHRRFERTCWEVLGRLEDDDVGSEMWVKCWSGLASIYSASPRLIRRADAIRKLLYSVEYGGDPDRDQSSDEEKPAGISRVVS